MSRPTPSAQSRLNYSSRLLMSASSWMLSISRNGDSTISQSNLFRCLPACALKKLFLMLKQNFLCVGMCPSPLVLSLDVTEKSLVPSSLLPPVRCLYTPIRSPSQAFPSPSWKVPALSASPGWQMLQPLNPLCGPLLDAVHCVRASLWLGSPEADTVVQLRSPLCSGERKGHRLNLLLRLGTSSAAGTQTLFGSCRSEKELFFCRCESQASTPWVSPFLKPASADSSCPSFGTAPPLGDVDGPQRAAPAGREPILPRPSPQEEACRDAPSLPPAGAAARVEAGDALCGAPPPPPGPWTPPSAAGIPPGFFCRNRFSGHCAPRWPASPRTCGRGAGLLSLLRVGWSSKRPVVRNSFVRSCWKSQPRAAAFPRHGRHPAVPPGAPRSPWPSQKEFTEDLQAEPQKCWASCSVCCLLLLALFCPDVPVPVAFFYSENRWQEKKIHIPLPIWFKVLLSC